MLVMYEALYCFNIINIIPHGSALNLDARHRIERILLSTLVSVVLVTLASSSSQEMKVDAEPTWLPWSPNVLCDRWFSVLPMRPRVVSSVGNDAAALPVAPGRLEETTTRRVKDPYVSE